jgi:hypothetical protein
MAAAHRRAEREQTRRHRELERASKESAKREALSQASLAVDLYDLRIARITSVHQECGDPWNWESIAAAPPPLEPRPTNQNEAEAKAKANAYAPGLLDKMLGRVDRRRRELTVAVEAGRKADVALAAKARSDYEQALKDWQETRAIAQGVLALDPDALGSAVEELSPIAELSDLGSRVNMSFGPAGKTAVTMYVNGQAVIPSDVCTLTKSGKLSQKKMPLTQFYELYQDYVAGAVFRIARELFALLPIETVVVTAMGHLFDSASGHSADHPILSVVMPRSTVQSLNFASLDPSDALRNFVHRMNFRRGKGFEPIEPLSLEGLLLSKPVERST